jgi:hypothetical protein
MWEVKVANASKVLASYICPQLFIWTSPNQYFNEIVCFGILDLIRSNVSLKSLLGVWIQLSVCHALDGSHTFEPPLEPEL